MALKTLAFSLVSVVTLKSKPTVRISMQLWTWVVSQGFRSGLLCSVDSKYYLKNGRFLSQQNSLTLILLPCLVLLGGGVGNLCIVLGHIMKYFLYSSNVETVYIMVDRIQGSRWKKPKPIKQEQRKKGESFFYTVLKNTTTKQEDWWQEPIHHLL